MMNNFFFKKNLAVDAIMCKIIAHPDRAQMALYGACTLDNQGYRHTLRICNNYCFSTV